MKAANSAGVNASELEVVLREGGRPHAAVLEEIRQHLAHLAGVDVEIGQPISHRLDHLLSGTRAQIAVWAARRGLLADDAPPSPTRTPTGG